MEGTSVHVKNIKQLFVIRWEIDQFCYGFQGAKTFGAFEKQDPVSKFISRNTLIPTFLSGVHWFQFYLIRKA